MGEDRAKATISEANESHGQAVKVFQAVAATTVTIAPSGAWAEGSQSRQRPGCRLSAHVARFPKVIVDLGHEGFQPSFLIGFLEAVVTEGQHGQTRRRSHML